MLQRAKMAVCALLASCAMTGGLFAQSGTLERGPAPQLENCVADEPSDWAKVERKNGSDLIDGLIAFLRRYPSGCFAGRAREIWARGAGILSSQKIFTEAQQLLYERNFGPGTSTQFDGITANAVIEWQRRRGDAATGTLTEDQLGRLRTEVAPTEWASIAVSRRFMKASKGSTRKDAEVDAMTVCAAYFDCTVISVHSGQCIAAMNALPGLDLNRHLRGEAIANNVALFYTTGGTSTEAEGMLRSACAKAKAESTSKYSAHVGCSDITTICSAPQR